MRPGIGKVVHYTSYGTPSGEYRSECRAAVVVELNSISSAISGEMVSLCVLNPTGIFFKPDCVHQNPSNPPLGGTWHWPGWECP